MVSSFYTSGYDSKRKRSTKTPSRKYEAENTSWRDESVHRGGQDSYQKTSRCGKNLKSSNTESYVRNKYLTIGYLNCQSIGNKSASLNMILMPSQLPRLFTNHQKTSLSQESHRMDTRAWIRHENENVWRGLLHKRCNLVVYWGAGLRGFAKNRAKPAE